MLLKTLASLGLATFLSQTAYGQCKLEQGEFYLLGSDPVTFFYDAELRDVAKSKAIENIDEKTFDDSDFSPTLQSVVKEKIASYVGPYRTLIQECTFLSQDWD